VWQNVAQAIEDVKTKGKVVIYGSSSEALAALQGLLASGIAPDRILYLAPEVLGLVYWYISLG